MSRLIFKISYIFYLILSAIFLLTFVIFFILATVSYFQLRDLKNLKDIKVSYQEVEEIGKKENKNTQGKSTENIENNYQKMENVLSEEDRLIEEISQLLIEKGYNLDKHYLKNMIHTKFPEEEIRINFLKGLKSVIELSSIEKLRVNMEIYTEEFEKKYLERKAAITDLEGNLRNSFIIASVSFGMMVLIALSLAIFSIEANVNHIMEALKNESSKPKI